MSITLQSRARGLNDCHVQNIIMYRDGKIDRLKAQRCRKYILYAKKLQIQVPESHYYQQMSESLCGYCISKLF